VFLVVHISVYIFFCFISWSISLHWYNPHISFCVVPSHQYKEFLLSLFSDCSLLQTFIVYISSPLHHFSVWLFTPFHFISVCYSAPCWYTFFGKGGELLFYVTLFSVCIVLHITFLCTYLYYNYLHFYLNKLSISLSNCQLLLINSKLSQTSETTHRNKHHLLQ